MTRILLVSDLHYALPQLDWVVGAASSFDIVVFAGDHLDISSPVPPEAQIVVLLKYFELVAEHIQVIVASGNHDLTARDGHGEKSAPWLAHALGERTRIDGDILDRHDLRITVCPWWDGPAGKARVDELLERAGTDRPARWLWVYHWPPDETRVSWTGPEALRRPRPHGVDRSPPPRSRAHRTRTRPAVQARRPLDRSRRLHVGVQPGAPDRPSARPHRDRPRSAVGDVALVPRHRGATTRRSPGLRAAVPLIRSATSCGSAHVRP
ncbi:MAG: metallophosphoesterase, partial [Actinobacteria bacterium]